MSSVKMRDVIIIGGGPAGMTAGLYTARKKLDTLLITSELGGQMLWTEKIENYMGVFSASGFELITRFEEQLNQFAVDIVYDKVLTVHVEGNGCFCVRGEGDEYWSRSLIIATGKRPRRLGIPGETEFRGRGVAFCVTCDGPFFAGKSVAVVGGGNSGVQAALELSGIAEKVILLLRDPLTADPVLVDKLFQKANIMVMSAYAVQSIYGGQEVEKIAVLNLKNGEEAELAVQGVFVEIGLESNSELVNGVVACSDTREIIVDCRARTDIAGLFAAGDVTTGTDKQIVIATGEGAKAALGAYEYLLHKI